MFSKHNETNKTIWKILKYGLINQKMIQIQENTHTLGRQYKRQVGVDMIKYTSMKKTYSHMLPLKSIQINFIFNLKVPEKGKSDMQRK